MEILIGVEAVSAKIKEVEKDVDIVNVPMRQLIRYTSGDEIATHSLTKLKKIYISFITAYYYEAMKLGKKKEAMETFKHFSEEILKEDEETSIQIANILSYKMLS